MKRIGLLAIMFSLVASCSSQVATLPPDQPNTQEVSAQSSKELQKNLFAKYSGYLAKDVSGKYVLEIEKKDFFGAGKAQKTKDATYIYSRLEHGLIPTWTKASVKGNIFLGKDSKLYLSYTAGKTYIILGEWQKITDVKLGQKINFTLDKNLKLSFTDKAAVIDSSYTGTGTYYNSEDKPELL